MHDFLSQVPTRHRETVCIWLDVQISLGIRNVNVLVEIAKCISRELGLAYWTNDEGGKYWEIAALFDAQPDAARSFAANRLRAFDTDWIKFAGTRRSRDHSNNLRSRAPVEEVAV